MPDYKRSTKIKILFLTKWYPNRYDPQLGVFIWKHALAVAKYCEVAVLHIFSDERMTGQVYDLVLKREAGFNSVIIYFRKCRSSFDPFNKIINTVRYLRAYSKGLKYIRGNFGEHELTHAYILLRPAILAYWMRMTRRKPFVVSEQWSGFATGRYEEKNWLSNFLTRYIVRKANAITVVSEFLKENMLKNRVRGNFSVIPNVIETPDSPPASVETGKLIVLTVADLVDEIKNVSGTLKAFAAIASKYNNIELHIIGEGKDRKKLEMLAFDLNVLDKIVFFHGLKSNEEVYQSLLKCDFLVMNSYFETFSLI